VFFQPRDPAHCVRAILRVRDQEKRESLIQKGIQRAKLFNWASCANETIRVYEELIALRPSEPVRDHALSRSN